MKPFPYGGEEWEPFFHDEVQSVLVGMVWDVEGIPVDAVHWELSLPLRAYLACSMFAANERPSHIEEIRRSVGVNEITGILEALAEYQNTDRPDWKTVASVANNTPMAGGHAVIGGKITFRDLDESQRPTHADLASRPSATRANKQAIYRERKRRWKIIERWAPAFRSWASPDFVGPTPPPYFPRQWI